ncbi:MAG: B12-binding domain-containing radical SAM protein [Planctomycetes bacterium]|nr:B12-binding domain-containing radical SAM protein [Planctomycetota bacterium]
MRMQFINATLGGDYSALDIAITCLATYLNERTRHRATIVDMTFHRHEWREHLRRSIERDKPDILGISANTLYMEHVKRILAEVKKRYRIPIILGGYHASISPERTFAIPQVDYVCIGDGEYALTELLDRIEAGRSAEGVRGIWAKENGRQIRNPRGNFIEDVDSLPIPNWDLWEDLDLYFYFLGMLYIIGTRGCPYRCTYCDAHGISKSVDGRYYRVRDPRKYAQEIGHHWSRYKHRGLRLAQLFDQVFTLDEDWVREFCDEYRRLGIHREFRFSCFSRIDNITPVKAEMLGQSGCALLRVGIEAGDSYIRNEIYKKRISDEKIREIFRVCRQHGIEFTAYFMLGGPGETLRTMQRTIDLATELDAARSAFFIYKPFTEEGLKQIVEHGGYVDEARWKAADNITFDAVVKLKGITPHYVEYLQRRAYFLTFGRRLLRMLKRLNVKYFSRLATYVLRGLRHGMDARYLLIYFHIYGYDNIDR